MSSNICLTLATLQYALDLVEIETGAFVTELRMSHETRRHILRLLPPGGINPLLPTVPLIAYRDIPTSELIAMTSSGGPYVLRFARPTISKYVWSL